MPVALAIQQSCAIAQVAYGCPPSDCDHADQLPNWMRDRDFAQRLRQAHAAGQKLSPCSRDVATQRALDVLGRMLN